MEGRRLTITERNCSTIATRAAIEKDQWQMITENIENIGKDMVDIVCMRKWQFTRAF